MTRDSDKQTPKLTNKQQNRPRRCGSLARRRGLGPFNQKALDSFNRARLLLSEVGIVRMRPTFSITYAWSRIIWASPKRR